MERPLLFEFGALVRFQERTGKDPFEFINQALSGKLNLPDLCHLVSCAWSAGARETGGEDPRLGHMDVADLIRFDEVPGILAMLRGTTVQDDPDRPGEAVPAATEAETTA